MDEGMIRIRRIKPVFPDVVEESEEVIVAMSSDGETTQIEKKTVWHKVGKWCMYALAVLTPLFFLPGTSTPIEVSKTIFVLGVTLLATLSLLIATIETRSVRYPRSWLLFLVFAIFVVFGLSTIFSKAPIQSVFGNLVEASTLLVMATFAFNAFLASYFLDRSDAAKLGWGVVLSAGVVAAIGLLHIYGTFIFPWDFTAHNGFNTVGSLFGWATMLAAVLSGITVANKQGLSRGKRMLLFIVSALIIWSLVVINYQLIWVSLAILMIMISAARFVAREGLGLPIVIAVLAATLSLLSGRIPTPSQIPTEIRPNFSTSWSVAKDVLLSKRFALGTGPATFGYDFSLSRPEALNQSNFWSVRFTQGYNLFVGTLATTGVLGVLAFFALIYVFFRYMIRSFADPEVFPIITGILFCIITWFSYPEFLTQLVAASIGLGLIAKLISEERFVSFETLSPARSFISFLVAMLLVALSLSGFYVLGQKYYAAMQSYDGLQAYAAGDLDGALKGFGEAIRWDSTSDEYLRAMSQALLAQTQVIINQSGAEATEAQQSLAGSVRIALRAIEADPANPENYINAATVYEAAIPLVGGADTFAVEYYQKARSLDPFNPQIPVQTARALMASASVLEGIQPDEAQLKLTEAERALEDSIRLKPDYAPARFLLAQLYLRQGNLNKALEKTNELKAISPLDAGLAFQVGLLYYQVDQLDAAQQEFERAIALSPDYSNARYFLGVVYSRRGQTGGAIDQFERIEKLNPDNAEVKQILENLRAGKGALSGITPAPESRDDVPISEDTKKP